MVQARIIVSDKHYEYLRQRAQEQGASLDQVVSEIIEADLAWHLKLADDPISELIGRIDDSFAIRNGPTLTARCWQQQMP